MPRPLGARFFTQIELPGGFTKIMVRRFNTPSTEVNVSALNAANALKREFHQLIHRKKVLAADRVRRQYINTLYNVERTKEPSQGSLVLTLTINNGTSAPTLNTS
jgi:hypothetical protein